MLAYVLAAYSVMFHVSKVNGRDSNFSSRCKDLNFDRDISSPLDWVLFSNDLKEQSCLQSAVASIRISTRLGAKF